MALNRKAGAWHTQAGPCPDSREQGRGRGDAVSRVVKTQECGQSHTATWLGGDGTLLGRCSGRCAQHQTFTCARHC